MRIISGKLGGRVFDSPHGHRTHPMSEKARGALFNMLGDISGLSVLDAFAGSGALSFEAISRGAAIAIAIDQDRSAQTAIATNISKLNINNQVKLIKASASAWLQTNPDAKFDIVLCDPPYDDLQTNLLQLLAKRVKTGGLLALSWPGGQKLPEFTNLDNVESRDYGDIQLAFYRKIG